MNWDISIGRVKQFGGRAVQAFGERFGRRGWILQGEALEYRGRLQMRYGMLKHQVQWNDSAIRARSSPSP